MGQSCGALLSLAGRSCGTPLPLLRNSLVRRSCGSRFWGALVWHSCGTLFAGLSCGTFLLDMHVGRSCGTRLWGTIKVSNSQPRLAPESHTSVSYETCFKIHSSSLQSERFPRDLLKNSRFKSAKRASASFETSTKIRALSLQNERFARDFLQKSHVKVSKTSVSYEISSKSQAGGHIGAHTSSSPAKQFRNSSPSNQHPLAGQSQCHSDIHLHNLTTPCACHENCTSAP